jgi:hypothetical protein
MLFYPGANRLAHRAAGWNCRLHYDRSIAAQQTNDWMPDESAVFLGHLLQLQWQGVGSRRS